MALKNFIIPGSYLRIEHLSFSKQRTNCEANIFVYSDDTCKKLIIPPYSVQIIGGMDELFIDGIIKDEVFLQDPKNISTVGKLIEFDKPSSEYAKSINNFVVYKNDAGIVSFMQPMMIYNTTTNTPFICNDQRQYVIQPIITGKHQFTTYFSQSNNRESLFYKYLKTLPEYCMCVDC